MVEDDITYVIGGEQFPYIEAEFPRKQEQYYYTLNAGEMREFYYEGKAFEKFGPIKTRSDEDEGEDEDEVETGQDYDDFTYPKGDYAACFGGILGGCFDKMTDGKTTLREALSKTLAREGYDAFKESPAYREEFDTPWHLRYSGMELPQDLYRAWLERGRQDIAAIKERRLTDYVPPADPFKAMFEDLYGTDIKIEDLG